ncbi:hypothetical protein M9Y10_040307 [Tritrichomonas musculus]|uniref:E3 ubiquitin-protein ligase n=1 Tax=Tritrichomonas musculus TaxID=1915356 RepID=A0ABR2GQJ0_9EUKA
MDLSSKDIKLLFICDPQEAIAKCQEIICSASNFSTFQDFYNYHLQNSHVSTCQNEWSTNRQMSIHCDDCSNSKNSCICLQCFLNGNHQGHTYVVNPNSVGNCDCGDLSLWKRSGFCKHHQGLENDSHPENYLDEKLRTALTDTVFKGAFSAIKHLTEDNGENLPIIFQFLKSFLKFGDGFRRLLVISLTERINFDKLFDSIFEATPEFNSQLQKFCGLLINDQLFKYKFCSVDSRLMADKIIPCRLTEMETGLGKMSNIKSWDSFWFHGFQSDSIKYCIDHNGFNLIEFAIQILNYMKELYSLMDRPPRSIPDFFYQFPSITRATVHLNDDQIQNLFDQIFVDVLSKGSKKGFEKSGKNDTIISTTFSKDTRPEYFQYLFDFNAVFYDIFDAFKSKDNLKFDKMFDELNRLIDIRPIFLLGKNAHGEENDKFVSKFIQKDDQFEFNEIFYDSFVKGGSFFISHPIVHSLAFLMRNDDLSRRKIAQFLKMEKYSNLRVQLGILAVKSVISQICVNQSIVPQTNLGALNYYYMFDRNAVFSNFGIPLLFPLLQLLIGLQCDVKSDFNLKEFFAFEVAKQFGFFDSDSLDIEDGNVKKIIFSFLYFTLLLVIERTLFNFDGYKYVREQIIFQLKKGVSDLNDLKNKYDLFVCDLTAATILNKVVSEVSTPRQKAKKGQNKNGGEHDVTFELKEGIDFNLISAINSFNHEKTIMNEMIQKHPESLIKIQKFEPEETYFFNQNDENNSNDLSVRLKDFLFTPTVFAIVYQTLRNDNSHKVELNEHLAMNILVLISKFIQENSDENDPSFDENLQIQYDSKLIDLISKLKRSVFELNIDSNEEATIKNIMNKKAFNLLMRMKISSTDEQPKSLVDLLLEKGEIGKNVLDQLCVQIDGISNEQEKEDLNKMKKIRAQKLKEDIMNQYKTMTMNFNKNEDDENEDDETISNTDKEICSICSNVRKNEVLSYPLYIYRTKFPFIVDKPPNVTIPIRIAMKEADVFLDDDNIMKKENNQDDEEEEENIPDPEDVFAHFLSQIPGLDITNDMSEDEIIARRERIEMLHQTIVEQYNKRMEFLNERKRQREEERKIRIQKEKEERIEREKQLEKPELPVTKQLTAGNLFVIQFGICQHLVHHDCVDKENFTCPIDRSIKNGFLPNIDDLSNDAIFSDKSNFELSEELKDSLNFFISKYSLFFKAFDEKIVDLFVELVKSISGLISTYEVRLRSLPDCLDSKKTKLLSRNLFLTCWYAYRMKGKLTMKTGFVDDVSEDVELRLTVFQKFIKRLIECDEIEESVSQKKEFLNRIISSFKKESKFENEKEFCLFLRRVCLADHFLLKQDESQSKLIDWDDILSVENLSQKFEVTFKTAEFDFKPITFAKLPKEFLRFAQEPYNYPVEKTNFYTVFNLIDYNQMIKRYNDLDEEDDSNIDYSSRLTCFNSGVAKSFLSFAQMKLSKLNYPSVLIFIGKESSNILIIEGKRLRVLRPFYLDKYGCTDIGYERRGPLFLNEERYDRVIDQILSGDFSNGLNSFST